MTSLSGTPEQIALVNNRDQKKIALVIIKPTNLSNGQIKAFGFSSVPWLDTLGEDEGVEYDPILVGDINITQAFGAELFGGSTLTFGSIQIDTSSRMYDDVIFAYAWIGAETTVYTAPFEDYVIRADSTKYFTNYKGNCSGIEISSDSRIKIDISPESANANGDIMPLVIEDGEERRFPVCYGRIWNFSAPILDDLKRIYQPSVYDAVSIDDVFIAAVAQTFDGDYINRAALEAASIATGRYATCINEGLFRLGSDPQGGAVTCDMVGRAGSFIDEPLRAGAIIREISQFSVVPGTNETLISWDLNDNSAAELDRVAQQELGFVTTNATNALDICSKLAQSVGAVFWWNNISEMWLKQIGPPDDSSAYEGVIDERFDVIGDISVQRWQTPVYRYSVLCKENLTVQNGDGLPAVIDRELEFINKQWTEKIEVSTAAKNLYADARQIVQESSLAQDVGGRAIASRLLQITSRQRYSVNLRVYNRAGSFALTDIWRVYSAKYWPQGKNMMIIAVSDNLLSETSDLTLWY